MNAQPAIDREAPRAGSIDAPLVPEDLEQTGLSPAFISDLLLKTLYKQGARTGAQIEDFVKLPFPILDDLLLSLQQRRLVEVRGAQGHGRRGYAFDLTNEGRDRCREVLRSSPYTGAAPVPLSEYWKIVEAQAARQTPVTRDQLLAGFEHLVFDGDFLESLGPAVNSGKSLFLYGHAGNGKTTIAEAIASLLGGAIYIPYAVEVDGQILGIYDPVVHHAASTADESDGEEKSYLRLVPQHDQRYVRIKRPVVMVGGELTLDELELQYDAQAGLFRAPPQVKANGGVFIIDDFGRQLVRPRDLLNRWMIPLERHLDYLSLPMGHKLPVPFECLLIFATNLNPTELVEEAFLRRIQYKILVGNPSREAYEEIFQACCDRAGLDFSAELVEFVYSEFYQRRDIPARACHPRDIVNHLLDIARYGDEEPKIDAARLTLACRSYFLDMPGAGMPTSGPSISIYDG